MGLHAYPDRNVLTFSDPRCPQVLMVKQGCI